MVEAEIVPATGNLCLNRRPPLSAGPPSEMRSIEMAKAKQGSESDR
jgi:hypothetical protein